jgi:hypothetical protein
VALEAYPFAVLLEQPTRIREAPTSRELQAVGQLGLEFGRSGRIGGLSSIASRLGIPSGAWAGRSKLFEHGDARVAGLLRLLSRPRVASTIATNLAPAIRFGEVSPMLTLVTAQREHGTALYAASARLVDSFWEGGLDHLWPERNNLGLPESVVGKWKPIRPYPNPDAHLPLSERVPLVEPAMIPARDQLMIYAAQINASFQRFLVRLSFARLRPVSTRVGTVVWQALCFLAPGGAHFRVGESLAGQIGQRFGAQSILEYLMGAATGGGIDLDRVFKDPLLNHSAWIKSAKIRAAECMFLERLLSTVRDLKLAGP